MYIRSKRWKLKKQSQFVRAAYCVMRIAKTDLKKQSQSRPSAGSPKYEIRNKLKGYV